MIRIYEFHGALEIPKKEAIEMEPPKGFVRAHRGVKPGTWSDDGAQVLCLLESLLEKGRLDLDDFLDKILQWYEKGLWALDHDVFDVGIQTSEALRAYKTGMPAEQCGNDRPEGKGNGVLMRVLPYGSLKNRKILDIQAIRRDTAFDGRVFPQPQWIKSEQGDDLLTFKVNDANLVEGDYTYRVTLTYLDDQNREAYMRVDTTLMITDSRPIRLMPDEIDASSLTKVNLTSGVILKAQGEETVKADFIAAPDGTKVTLTATPDAGRHKKKIGRNDPCSLWKR